MTYQILRLHEMFLTSLTGLVQSSTKKKKKKKKRTYLVTISIELNLHKSVQLKFDTY